MRRQKFHDLKVERLGFVPLFQGLEEPELIEVARLSTETKRPAGTSLLHEGGTGLQAFIVLEGRVHVRSDGEHVATLGAGDVVGEMAVLDRQPRVADVVAATDVQLLVFDPRAFASLMAEVPTCHERVRGTIDRRRLAAA